MRLSRAALAAFFTFTGTMHFLRPRSFEAIVPPAGDQVLDGCVLDAHCCEAFHHFEMVCL